MTDLQRFTDRFTDILQAEEPIRTKRLTQLMNDLEQCYNIPMRFNAKFESNNPGVMQLYRNVSKARNLEEV